MTTTNIMLIFVISIGLLSYNIDHFIELFLFLVMRNNPATKINVNSESPTRTVTTGQCMFDINVGEYAISVLLCRCAAQQKCCCASVSAPFFLSAAEHTPADWAGALSVSV